MSIIKTAILGGAAGIVAGIGFGVVKKMLTKDEPENDNDEVTEVTAEEEDKDTDEEEE